MIKSKYLLHNGMTLNNTILCKFIKNNRYLRNYLNNKGEKMIKGDISKLKEEIIKLVFLLKTSYCSYGDTYNLLKNLKNFTKNKKHILKIDRLLDKYKNGFCYTNQDLLSDLNYYSDDIR